jgi:hypothetical protein
MGSPEGTTVGKEHGQERSAHWHHVRDQFLKINPKCAACGSTDGLEVHHIMPFHICLDLGRGYAELDPRNLITLCRTGRNCHQLLGHLDDFSSYCLTIKLMIPHFRVYTDEAGIRADKSWQNHHLHRPRFKMYAVTDGEKAALIDFIDTHYPIASIEAPVEVPA